MSYLKSITFAFTTVTAIFFLGPIVVIPVSFWVVFGPAEEIENGKTISFGVNKIFILNISTTLILWFTVALIIPGVSIRDTLFNIAHLPVFNSMYQDFVLHFYTERYEFGESCRRCFRAYGTYLFSLIPITITILFLHKNITYFREYVEKSTSGMHKKRRNSIKIGCIILSLFLIYGYILYYIGVSFSQRTQKPPILSTNILMSSGAVLLFFVCALVLMAALKHLKSFRTQQNGIKK